jgi:RNA polymerase sigma-70 factor, ECF subfamily
LRFPFAEKPVGNPSSYERFAERLAACHTQLFGYLYALVQNVHDTEDVYQKACLVLWRKFDQYQEGTNFFHWAKAVAHYEAMNFLRSKHQRPALFSEEFQAELATVWAEVEPDVWGDRRRALEHCMEKLPENDRRLVDQCYGGGGALCEAAGRLGRSPKSIYDALGRIRRVLLRCVETTLAREGR